MATIMSLPNEIIFIILEKLSIKDIEYFSSTCKRFRHIEWGNILWIKKFYQRWPIMKNVYGKMKSEDLQQIDFKNELKENAKFAKEMWEFVHQLFMDNSNDDIKKDLLLNFLYSNAGSTNYFLLLDEFKRLFAQSAREPGHDLTRRFNSRFIFRLIRHSRTRFKYLKFINKPKEQQFLEQLVTIVVQWFTPLQHVSYSRIQALLDQIAQQVLQTLRKECPKHPILTVANEYYIYWKTNNVNYSYWNYKEILPISFITERIIFSQTYFQTLNQLWLTNQNQDAYNISEGSERLFLLTIYHSVLRRFGIYSLLIGGCLLQIFWKPIDNNGLGYYSIGLQSGRFFLVPNNRSIDKRCHYKTITKLVDHLEKELQTLHPGEIHMLNCMLLRQYVNITDVMMWFCEFTIPKKRIVEERSPRIKFVIGTIVTHRCIDKIHIGVIVGWTSYYYPPACIMKFNNFPFHLNILCTNWQCTDSTCNTHKPYYVILCDNDLFCYAEHEFVSKCDSPRWINNKEIGRYFYRFEDDYYLPNEMLARDYPFDVAIINEIRRN